MTQSTTKLFTLFAIVALCLLSSCKPQVPSRYLQPDEMEDILFDFHLAMAMDPQSGSGASHGLDALEMNIGDMPSPETEINGYRSRQIEAAVLKNHGVTPAEFDSALVYYTRHSDRFQQIYENIAKRLSDEAMALGASASDISNFGENFSSGDTANIWKEMPSHVLTTTEPFNIVSFSLKADTEYHRGDKIVLSFDTQFILQDGVKDAVAMLAVTFQNDSVGTRVIHMQSSENYNLAVNDDQRLGIKEVKGFISLQNRADQTRTTLKLLFLQNIRLIRCHQKEIPAVQTPAATEEKRDTDENTQNSQQQSIRQKPIIRPVRSGGMR